MKKGPLPLMEKQKYDSVDTIQDLKKIMQHQLDNILDECCRLQQENKELKGKLDVIQFLLEEERTPKYERVPANEITNLLIAPSIESEIKGAGSGSITYNIDFPVEEADAVAKKFLKDSTPAPKTSPIVRDKRIGNWEASTRENDEQESKTRHSTDTSIYDVLPQFNPLPSDVFRAAVSLLRNVPKLRTRYKDVLDAAGYLSDTMHSIINEQDVEQYDVIASYLRFYRNKVPFSLYYTALALIFYNVDREIHDK